MAPGLRTPCACCRRATDWSTNRRYQLYSVSKRHSKCMLAARSETRRTSRFHRCKSLRWARASRTFEWSGMTTDLRSGAWTARVRAQPSCWARGRSLTWCRSHSRKYCDSGIAQLWKSNRSVARGPGWSSRRRTERSSFSTVWHVCHPVKTPWESRYSTEWLSALWGKRSQWTR